MHLKSGMRIYILICLIIGSQCVLAADFYVSITGDDVNGHGSLNSPWKTLRHALKNISPDQDHILKISEGKFIEDGPLELPSRLSLEGAGIDKTFISPAASFFYHPVNPGYATEKFFIMMNGIEDSHGGQSIKNLTIDGNEKKLHGGLFVRNRNNVEIKNIRIKNVNFCGIWILNSKGSTITNTSIINCAWTSTEWCSGALQLGNLEDVEINNLSVDENNGYGIKALADETNKLKNLKIHDSRISVNPSGVWNDGKAPNISIELWSVDLTDCEISYCYVDNHISLVNTVHFPPLGSKTIRIHHNTIDLSTRANGNGYGVELSINEVEIDHNIFMTGKYGIVNWSDRVKNWAIHHNIFYGLSNESPGEVLRSQKNGLHHVKFYNNTIEFMGLHTMNLIGLYGGTSENLDIKNNLVINSNTSYNWYRNKLVHLENSALRNLDVMNNLFLNLQTKNIQGSFINNLREDPKIKKIGSRHTTYYTPQTGSPLIDAGINVNLPFKGSAPDIGAHEY
jgi:hypothetical protein